MCGISAVVLLEANSGSSKIAANGNTTNGHADPAVTGHNRLKEELDASLEKIRHRGPDAQGTWISPSGHVGFGHCRLAINDLSPDGSQPFHSPEDSVHAIVNGELYDHDRIRNSLIADFGYAFKGRSDCEIVLALYQNYGLSFLDQLRGEFALCLFDEKRQLFIAARDRYGIKPLFWSVVKGKLVISAEAKGLLPFGWEPEWDVRSIVDAGWGHDARTLFKGVQKLRPGHYMTCNPFGFIETRQYWDMEYPDKSIPDPRSELELVEGVRERMLEAIRLRLRADVPVGIYLSGGIDSSVIAGMATHLVKERGVQMGSEDAKKRICCFSIAFDEDSGFDESDISNRTAEWLGVNYLKKVMDEEELAKRLEEATYHCEHHNHDLNYVGKFALSESVREYGYKVVLTGEGADENFGGYPLYQPDFLSEPDPAWPAGPLSDSDMLRQQLRAQKEAEIAQMYTSIGANSKNRGSSLASRQLNGLTTPSSMLAFQPPLSLFAPWLKPVYGSLDPRDTIADNVDARIKTHVRQRWHPLHAAQYVWSKGHLANNFLSCLGDRTEMAHSVEARTPFLDHPLTEYVNGIPPSLKIRYSGAQAIPGLAGAVQNGDSEESRQKRARKDNTGKLTEKYILREASKPFITEELYTRTKHPYSSPTTYPPHGPIHQKFQEILTQDNVEALGFVQWEAVDTLLHTAFDTELSGQERTKAIRLVLIVSQWVVLGQRFGVRGAEAE